MVSAVTVSTHGHRQPASVPAQASSLLTTHGAAVVRKATGRTGEITKLGKGS